jgi:superfamily II DNA/RNA helicase
VAGRGLDVPNILTVVNFDPAKNLDAHVHRCGRAGRLLDNTQQVGTAYTLLTRKDESFARVLRNAFHREGREVSPELQGLARPASSGAAAAPYANQSGLGYNRAARAADSFAPLQKRSRGSDPSRTM